MRQRPIALRVRCHMMLCFVSLSCLSGCATLLLGTHQDVTFHSDPPGVTATVDGTGSVTTPGSLSIPRRNPVTVEFRADGYEPVSVEIERQVSPYVLGNLFCLILPGLLVDFLTGGAYQLEAEVFAQMQDVSMPPRTETRGTGDRPGRDRSGR